MQGGALKILIVDDHALFREGIAWILKRVGDGTQVIEAGSVAEGLACAATEKDIDLVFLDLYLPGFRGLDALKLFRKEYPAVRIVLLSGTDDAGLIREGLAVGAQGFIHKSATAEVLLAGVRDVLRGGSCHVAAPPPQADDDPALSQLTQRQREILTLMCDGMPYKEIARRLDISNATVRNHVSRIFETLDVHSRTEAAMLAYRNGLK